MKFTRDIPTTPGFYAWRQNEFSMPSAVIVTQTIKGLAAHFYSDLPAILHKDFCGEWCRLVPAEEVEKAWFESRNFGPSGCSTNLNDWTNSRAKRVMEGKE